MNYNKVYTPSMMIDEYRQGYGRARFLGIKEILDRGCESETNRFPTNDGVRNFDLLFFIVNIVMTLFIPILFAITVIGHVICFLYKYLRILFSVILTVIFTIFVLFCNIINGVAWIFGAKVKCPKYRRVLLPKKCPLSAIPLPNLSYPDCQACACEGRDAGEPEGDDFPEIEDNTTLLIDSNVNTFYDNLVGYNNGDQDKWTKFIFGFQTVMAGNDIYGDEQNSLTPWISGSDNPQVKARTWSRDLTLSERFNLFNVKSKYHQFGGQNRIDTYVNPNQNNFQKHSDNVVMLLLDPGQLGVFKSGQIVTFNDPDNTNDPNVSGSTTGTTIFQNQGNSNVTVTYMDPDPALGSKQQTYTITGDTASSVNYEFGTDIEYFQVITGQTLSEFENTLQSTAKGLSTYGNPNDTLGQFYVFGWQKVKKYYAAFSRNPDEYPKTKGSGNDYFEYNVPNIKLNSDWEDHCIVFLVRGVDPHTPRQDIKYDLSKLYGYSMGNGPQVRGNFKMNIPIQPYANGNSDWRIPRHNKIGANGQNCSETGLPIYFNSFSFSPNNNMFQTFKNKNIKYYSAMNVGLNSNGNIDPNVGNNTYNQNIKTEKQAVRTPQGSGAWSRMEGDGTLNDWKFNYRQNEVVEGGSLLMSKDSTRPEEGDWSYASPVYYKMNPNMDLAMLNSQKIVMRTDRLPTSDDPYKRFQLHQNKRFAIYTIDDDGTSVSYNLENGDSFGDGADDFNEDAGAIATQISQTFSCEGMVPLECYSGNGETIGVLPEDDRCYYMSDKKELKKMYGGCYYLLTKNFAFAEDFQSIAEWRARFRMMFGLCNNVVSLTFVNNWINGSLYMYAFQKDNVYGNNINETTFTSNPEYVYCKDTAVYQLVTNSFYYRASPYNPNNNLGERFIGRDNTPQTNILGRSNGANKKFLGNPTTMMDLGPRDLFTKEICYNPEFQGYIVDKISTSSYKDTSDVLQLFAISRLTASGFWESIIGFGDGSIQKLFSRPNQRLDGDVAQLLSINSEFGVVPYLGTNYSDSEIRYIGETRTLPNGKVVEDPTLGILFSANTINRDMISPGRYTFQDTLTSHLVDNYGHQDQEVPFHKWEIISTGSTIFGTQQNDWYSKKSQDGIGSVRYQTEDRLTSQDTFSTNVNMPSTQRPGYIYNSNIVNNQIETTDDKPNPFRNVIHAGSPYFFYFGLRKGASSMNRFIDKFIFNQEKL